MADLMIPIFVIIIMFLLIDEMTSPLPIMLIGLLFIPIILIWAQAVGDYDLLFGVSIIPYKTTIPLYPVILGAVMATVPVMAFLKLIYIRRGFSEALKTT